MRSLRSTILVLALAGSGCARDRDGEQALAGKYCLDRGALLAETEARAGDFADWIGWEVRGAASFMLTWLNLSLCLDESGRFSLKFEAFANEDLEYGRSPEVLGRGSWFVSGEAVDLMFESADDPSRHLFETFEFQGQNRLTLSRSGDYLEARITWLGAPSLAKFVPCGATCK